MSQAPPNGTSGLWPRLADAGLWVPERMKLRGESLVTQARGADLTAPSGFRYIPWFP